MLPKLHQFYESKFQLWFEAGSAFNRSQILTSRHGIERAAFSFGASYHIICDTLPREANHEMRSIAPQKILTFLLCTSIFYQYKFSGTEPSNFCVRCVELFMRLVLSWCCQTWQFHGKFSPPWMRVCWLKCNSRESKHQTGRIGSCKDLSDCSLSHKKWKLFSIVCQELGKLYQLSLTIGTRV